LIPAKLELGGAENHQVFDTVMTCSDTKNWQLPMRQRKVCSRMTGARLSGKV
jgi:hypothetical protein